jgi:hypothetical protein
MRPWMLIVLVAVVLVVVLVSKVMQATEPLKAALT